MGVSVFIACNGFLLTFEPPRHMNSKDTWQMMSLAATWDFRQKRVYTSFFPFFFAENPTSPTDHNPLSQLGEVCWGVRLVGDETVFGDLNRSKCCGVIYIWFSAKRDTKFTKCFILSSLVLPDGEMASSMIGHEGYRATKSST